MSEPKPTEPKPTPAPRIAGPMRESIPTRRLVAARRAYAQTGDHRPWHLLSALEQQHWVKQTPTPKDDEWRRLLHELQGASA